MLFLSALLLTAQAESTWASPPPPPSGLASSWIAPGHRLAYRVQMTFDDTGHATACRFLLFLPPTDPPLPTPQQVCRLESEIWAKFPAKSGKAGSKYINRYLPAPARSGADAH